MCGRTMYVRTPPSEDRSFVPPQNRFKTRKLRFFSQKLRAASVNIVEIARNIPDI